MTSSRTDEYIQSLRQSEQFGAQVAAYRMLPSVPAQWEKIPQDLPETLYRQLSKMGIKKLYSHQVDALASIRSGKHTVIATPTASGKSLIYNLALFEKIWADRASCGLYLFPLKALTQDQFDNFNQWADAMDDYQPSAAVYDGDTSQYKRRKIRDNPPNVVMTNPDMLHLALLPYHGQWAHFFKNLKLVVIDEVHTYRGILGAHFAQLMRRLKRICQLYQTSPLFVFASATVANPGFLAQQLTGLDVHTITQSGASRGIRHIVLLDAFKGPAHTAIGLLKSAMARRLRTIVYTQSRRLAELISIWAQQQTKRFSKQISVYRAGLRPDQRRKIETDLKHGHLLAVVSTSALELGMDIGDLDICILAGYPGSMIATHQRSGRVGRKGQDSALILIAGQDALDQYFMANPDQFFEGQAESAVVNPYNSVVLKAHLPCAAVECPLLITEEWIQQPPVIEMIAHLEKNGHLLRSSDGQTVFSKDRRPHRKVDLRSAGRRFRIMDGECHIGELNGFRVHREAHPGAVYFHQGQTYIVASVNDADSTIRVQPAIIDYYTRVRTDSDIHIIKKEKMINHENTAIYFGKIKVIDTVIGFEKVSTANGRNLGYTDLALPPILFETDSIWFDIPDALGKRTVTHGFDFMGSLHAAEHAIISVMPLIVLADRNDVGGLATRFHPQVNSAVIFVYDGLPGGAGLSSEAFVQSSRLIRHAAAVIQRCECKKGCPACVHSPKCGSGNNPIDKNGAHFLLEEMAASGPKDDGTADAVPVIHIASPTPLKRERPSLPLRYGVFDLETQHAAEQVGGWQMAHLMKMSCGVVYDSADNTYSVYLESQVAQLVEHLRQLDLVVGFNSKRFDYRVLSGYGHFALNSLPSLDILECVHQQLGFRLSLDHLARETLQIQKIGSGLDALRWWQAGQMDKIIQYCRKDVQITRDLYLFGKNKKYLIYQQRDGNRLRIPLEFP